MPHVFKAYSCMTQWPYKVVLDFKRPKKKIIGILKHSKDNVSGMVEPGVNLTGK